MRDGPILGIRADEWARRAILWLTLVFCCVLGLITPYLLGVICIVLFLAMLVRGRIIDAYRDRAAQLFLAVFVGLGICYAVSAQAPADVLNVFNVVMLLLFGPLLVLMQRGAATGNATRLADLAWLGTIVTFIFTLIGVFVFRWVRAEAPHFGAILLANTTLLLAALSLTAIIAGGSYRKYLVAPALAVIVLAFSGSRGPLLALVPLTILAAWSIQRARDLRPRVVILAALAFLAYCALVFVLLDSRVLTLLGILREGPMTDTNSSVRLFLWEAGWEAFLHKPFFGHGWERLMSAVYPFMHPDYLGYAQRLPQLHNDVVNFAVAAGIVGVALYLVLLTAPFVAARRLPADSQSAARMFGVTALVIAYACDGLTDIMFGFEYHTALFVCLSAILVGWCRDPGPVR